jgi:NCS2 family nucleobase:cation symporter-2
MPHENDVSDKGRQQDPNHTPPLRRAVPLGLQHVLAMFVGNITVPIIIAGILGVSPEEKIFLIQVAIFIAGVATLIQTIGVGPIGAKLPIVQGTSFGFLPVSIPIAKTYGFAALFGGALIGGFVQLGLGVVLKKIRHWFPPIVTGVVVLVIGISLMKVALIYAGGGQWLMDNKPELFASGKQLFLAATVLLVTLGVHQFARGFLSMASILTGLVVGYLIAIPLGMVNFDTIANAAWFAFPAPLKFGLEFNLAAILGMSIMALITTIESVGDISGITIGGAGREATDRELSGGIMADGVGTAMASLFGALPNTSYSQNVGVVAFTGVMSRHVVTIGAIFLVLAGLIPKLGAIVSAMPQAVLGGASIVMFGMIAAAGVKLLSQEVLNRRNMLIIAISLTFGIGLPLAPKVVQYFPTQLAVVMESGIVPAGVFALIMDRMLPREKKKGVYSGGISEAE